MSGVKRLRGAVIAEINAGMEAARRNASRGGSSCTQNVLDNITTSALKRQRSGYEDLVMAVNGQLNLPAAQQSTGT